MTQQGGHVSGAFGATPADQIANMTNGSFVGQVGVKNIAQVDQLNGANTQATFQTGFKNNAMIDQKTQVFGTGNGANNAVTAQFGTKNQANVAQSMAVPLALGDNNSFITQIGRWSRRSNEQQAAGVARRLSFLVLSKKGRRRDGSVVRRLWRDDPDRLVPNRRCRGRDVLSGRGIRAAQFDRDFAIQRPGEVGKRSQCDFGFAGQLAIDVRSAGLEPARQFLLGQAALFFLHDRLEQLAAYPADEPAGQARPRVDVKPKERHQAQPPSRTMSHRCPVHGAAVGSRCDNPGRDHGP